LTNLYSLWLDLPQFSDEAINELQKALPDCDMGL